MAQLNQMERLHGNSTVWSSIFTHTFMISKVVNVLLDIQSNYRFGS